MSGPLTNPLPIILQRSATGRILATTPPHFETFELDPSDLAAFVDGTPMTRWVWDDTTRWYPDLLDAGVRIQYCTDLRLTRNILRSNPEIDQSLLTGPESERWDTLTPLGPTEPALFVLHDDPLDSGAEYRRQQNALDAQADTRRLKLLLNAESSGALIAAEMTHAGLPWRADIHDRLLINQLGPRPSHNARPAAMEALLPAIRAAFGDAALNPDSPAELLKALQRAGLPVTDTRSWTLERINHVGIAPLLEYKKLRRLYQANGWHWLETWVNKGRYRTQFLPGGVVTGRWAAVGGGALSIPTQLKSAVVADDSWKFVVADVAQLEPRCLAGMSSDEGMAEAARASDLYQALVDAKAVETRNDAKLGMLGAMYGATSGDSAKIVTRMNSLYPRAFGLVETAARQGEHGDVVQTFLGRGSPRPSAPWVTRSTPETSATDDRDRRSWGRFTRNFIVQGTGAEWALCWMASLRNRLWAMPGEGTLIERPHLVFFLHDEVLVHTPAHLADHVVAAVRDSATDAGRLLFGTFPVDFPLDVSIVDSYGEAK